MSLVSISDILNKAKKGKYAVGAFNADNLEMVQAFLRAAEMIRAPIILQVSQGAINYSGLDSIANIVLLEAKRATVPVAVHLDHGKDYPQNILALKAGICSLGIDASAFPYDENLKATKEICDLAHTAGLEAEAGIGYVPDSKDEPTLEEIETNKTDPNQAKEFVERTKVDVLAVALGSMRGMRARSIELDIDLLKRVNERINVPLVLHGASGIKWSSIQQAIQNGICKVNIAASFDRCFTSTIWEKLKKNPEEWNFRKILIPAREAVSELACEIITKLGSNDK
jgi:fructose-bisphosphate aldolase class II